MKSTVPLVRKSLFLSLGVLLGSTSAVTALAQPDSGGYTFFPTATAWNPGANTARVGGFPAPGGATFSIMGAGLTRAFGGLDADHGTNLTASITALAVPGWTVAHYEGLIDWALDTWAAVSGFTNLGLVADSGAHAGALESAGGHLGDIRVAAWEIDTAGVLAHAYQPGTQAIFGSGGTIAGDLHFDVARTWRDDATDTTADADFDIFTVALHEVGHALGLGHSGVVGSVMEPIYAGARRTLHADDIAGIQAIYGPNLTAVPDSSYTLFLLGVAFSLLAAWKKRS